MRLSLPTNVKSSESKVSWSFRRHEWSFDAEAMHSMCDLCSTVRSWICCGRPFIMITNESFGAKLIWSNICIASCSRATIRHRPKKMNRTPNTRTRDNSTRTSPGKVIAFAYDCHHNRNKLDHHQHYPSRCCTTAPSRCAPTVAMPQLSSVISYW